MQGVDNSGHPFGARGLVLRRRWGRRLGKFANGQPLVRRCDGQPLAMQNEIEILLPFYFDCGDIRDSLKPIKTICQDLTYKWIRTLWGQIQI